MCADFESILSLNTSIEINDKLQFFQIWDRDTS